MDVLVDVLPGLQERVFFAVANLLDLEVDLLFFDTTSTYWETDRLPDELAADDPDGDAAGVDVGGGVLVEGGHRRYGHSNVWHRHCVSSHRGVSNSPACWGLTWI
jgi:hypothetical protein